MGIARLLMLPDAPVWVIEDKGALAAGQASAIAGRLGLPFRRIGFGATDDRVRPGSLPDLVLTAGTRSGARALLLRARHGCRVVHCASTRPPVPDRLAGYPFDLMVLAGIEPPGPQAAPLNRPGRLMPALGPPHVVSPALLARARQLWEERLSHLPTPRIAVLLGGGVSDPAEAYTAAVQLQRMAREQGGCILLSASLECRPEIADTFSAGLSGCIHLIYREGEPGENPTLGFLGGADAVVAAWSSAQSLSEACAGTAPVFVLPAPRGRRRRLMERLIALDQARLFQSSLQPWPRTPLDEAGRIARAIRRRFMI